MPVIPTEAETRQNLIDRQLARAGWTTENRNLIEELLLPDSPDQVAEAHAAYQTGDEFADYALLGRDARLLAIVEAKRTSRDPLAGKRQADDYADRAHARYGLEPFIFLANGESVWFWDRERYAPRLVSGFFTQDDLERLAFQRQYHQPVSQLSPDPRIVDRLYQVEAIRRVTESLEQGKRKFLLVMATGTGKTRVAVALVDLLMRARWTQRVLFLADRRELVQQALDDFKEYMPNETRARVEGGEVDRAARILVATYPSMMQVLDSFSPGYFDWIVADESHRSIYNRYRAIFERFDACQLGLTATPTEYIDHNTFDLFECPTGLPTFIYPYEDAVKEEYLCDYRVLAAQTRFQIKGIKAGQLPPEIQRQLQEQGIELSEIDFEGTDLERRVTNTGTNDAIVREFMDKSIKDESGTLPRKSIIFAMSHRHAVELWQSFNRLYPQYKGRLAEVIDSHMERADKLLNDFKHKDMPRVAISVDMLDTGVDVPAVCNLVFAKPVYSRVKFWQMIGRGTRRNRDLRTGWEKTHFLIIDHWDNFSYFEMNPEGEIPSQPEALPVRLFSIRLDKLQALTARGRNEKAAQVIATLRADVAELPRDAAPVREYAELLAQVDRDDFWADLSARDMALLDEVVTPLMKHRPLTGAESEAMGFTLLTERLALAHLRGDDGEVQLLRGCITDDLRLLPTNLGEVQAKTEQLAWALSDGFWQHLDYARVMDVQATFAPLMRYRQRRRPDIIELNLPDEIIDRRWICYGPAGEGSYVETYRQQVEARVRELAESHPALIKLRRSEPLTEADVHALARLLNTPDLFVTEESLRQAYDNADAHLVDFVRHILGLRRLSNREEQIKAAFDEFIAAHPAFTATQVNFLRVLRSVVLRKAPVTTQDLQQPPFTRFGRDAASRLFDPPTLAEILDFANRVATSLALLPGREKGAVAKGNAG